MKKVVVVPQVWCPTALANLDPVFSKAKKLQQVFDNVDKTRPTAQPKMNYYDKYELHDPNKEKTRKKYEQTVTK